MHDNDSIGLGRTNIIWFIQYLNLKLHFKYICSQYTIRFIRKISKKRVSHNVVRIEWARWITVFIICSGNPLTRADMNWVPTKKIHRFRSTFRLQINMMKSALMSELECVIDFWMELGAQAGRRRPRLRALQHVSTERWLGTHLLERPPNSTPTICWITNWASFDTDSWVPLRGSEPRLGGEGTL